MITTAEERTEQEEAEVPGAPTNSAERKSGKTLPEVEKEDTEEAMDLRQVKK